jgi:hypothetical protein
VLSAIMLFTAQFNPRLLGGSCAYSMFIVLL